MKDVIFDQVVYVIMQESSAFQSSSKTDADLHELIKCVSIGTSSVDQISGKCNAHLSESSWGNFNPLTLPITPTVHLNPASDDEGDRNTKKSRLSLEEERPTVPELKASSQSADTDALKLEQRMKRKRRLLDDDHSVLITPVFDKCHKGSETNLDCLKTSSSNLEGDDLEKDKTCEETKTNFKNSLPILESVPPDPGLPQGDSKVTPQLPDLEKLSLHGVTPLDDISRNKLQSVDVSQETEELQTNLNSTHNMEVSGQIEDSTELSEQLESKRTLRKRIRKTLPPIKIRQTPLGLPKPQRLKKETFSIEEIYTNKNYSTPVPKNLETIFEYPKESKDGTLRYVEKRRKTRAVYFSTDPAERPAKKRIKTKFKKRATRRNKTESDADAHARLASKLSQLDQQLQLNGLSP